MKQTCLLDARVVVNESPKGFARLAANTVFENLNSTPDQFKLISLSGGNTPFPVYRLLPSLLVKAGMAKNCYWIQTDERLVDPRDERSNQKAILASLFADRQLSESQFIRVTGAGENCDHQKIAETYHNAMMSLPLPIRPPAPIDLVILGIGDDGHTASLFPETDWQKDINSGFAIFTPASQAEARLSLTFRRILQARRLLFLITGKGKQEIVEKVFFDSTCDCPAAVIARQRPTSWVLDISSVSPRMRSAL